MMEPLEEEEQRQRGQVALGHQSEQWLMQGEGDEGNPPAEKTSPPPLPPQHPPAVAVAVVAAVAAVVAAVGA